MGALDNTLAQETRPDDLVADALAQRGVPERVHYATGVLLDAADFADEQRYVRGRLARAFAALYGYGTLAGLRVSCPLTLTDAQGAKQPNAKLEVRVAPGLALDRIGRLIEVRFLQCQRIAEWLARRQDLSANDPDRLAVIAALRGEPRVLVLDVFIRFAVCPHGKTPAFAAGPFNATDYVVPARLADAFEITLEFANAVRVHPADPQDLSTELAHPAPRSPRLEAMLAALTDITDPAALEAGRRAWALESVLDAWPQPDPIDPSRLRKLPEHASEADWSKVFLARLPVPVKQAQAGGFPELDAARLDDPAGTRDLADNALRPVIFNPYVWRGA
jgi:hypothetical protein